ncbi:MAG: ATP-dependent helicase [Haliscomenobacter sp.]|nr:ATP-dependent helicase [Haliscomenobacter sp.]
MSEKRANRQAYNDFFLEQLGRLNPDQRRAVDHFEGPMLVIAGPGTGKTQILAARIGRVLLETDTLPENILCLTFTDAGVLAMRDRLLQFIGPAAHRVHLATFHSFCNGIIQDNLEYFGRYNLEPLSELERIDLIRSLIDPLKPGHPLSQPNSYRYFYERHLSLLFQKMKTEDWTPALVEQRADAWLDQLPEDPAFQYQRNQGANRKGDPKQAKLEDARWKMQKLKAAAALYPLYEQAKSQISRYDYDDMILWVLRAFEQHPFLLRNYQEKYLYFLVDEYQDTNGAQNEILMQLVAYWDVPNILVVGDDDQSIFEFQGARLQNLMDLYRRFETSMELVVLSENYRSAQPVLDAAAGLIGRNQQRILSFLASSGLEKRLRAAHPERLLDSGLPVIAEYPSRIHEVADIVHQIEQSISAGTPPSEIAILYARHKQAQEVQLLLQKKNIPFLTRRNVNVFHAPAVRQLLEILNYLRQEALHPHSGGSVLFRILHFRFWGIAPNDLAEISFFLQEPDAESPLTWRQVLHRPEAVQGLSEASIERFRAIGGLLDGFHTDEVNLPLPYLVESILNQSGILQAALEGENKADEVDVLNSFLSFVREEAERSPGMNTAELFRTIQRMEDNRIPLLLHKTEGTAEGVQLLSAHASKGLEFDRVFLIDCTSDYWAPNKRGLAAGFALPETLTYSGEEDALEARRRLFYVAMTRARSFLHISYAKKDEKNKERQRVQFIDELLTDQPGLLALKTTPPDIRQEALERMLIRTEAPLWTNSASARVAERLVRFRMSVTALIRFLQCPLGFYFEHILSVPQLPSAEGRYGAALHQALQRLFERMLASRPRNFPPESDLLLFFEQAFRKGKGSFDAETYSRYLEQGRAFLSLYYRRHLGAWHKDVSVEYTVRQVELDGVPITGTIDRIEYHKKLAVRLVDYKTGSHDPTRVSRPSAKNPLGGAYWRQLVFYKLLFEQLDRSSRVVTEGEIAYVHPDKQGAFPSVQIVFEPEDMRLVRELIVDTYARIMNQDFYSGCGKDDCVWCNLARQTTLPPSLTDMETESLDD